ncbi:MAG TPA: hypothetical protein VGN76_10520 [Gemmatimonadales bacterium]|nr:hypothetical protein [Gemmatimonadales bacterium]
MSVSSAAAEGIERLALYFTDLPTRQGVLARRALGRPAPGDEVLTRRLLETMRKETRIDGSVTGAVVPTIWRAHEFMDLGYRGDETSCARIMTWIMDLQRKPGAFNQGCNPTRHAHGVCEHFISGFFSPAPPDQRLAPVMLPNGKVFRGEPAARFAISCLALRAVLRARFDGTTIEQHVLSLIQLHERWTDWDGYFAADAIVAGVHALAFVPPPHRGILSGLATLVAGRQAADGSWPNADLFHTLEALLALGTVEARAAVRQAVPAVLSRQRVDGSFGSTAQQERALIALRSLIWAEQEA